MAEQTTASSNFPKVFISYTHETPEHQRWVGKFATDLRNNGIDVVLDQWECRFGTDLTLFMERGVSESKRVILVCTPEYKRKADQATGGVGYERLVVTSEIARSIDTQKFLCVVRRGAAENALPRFAATRLYADFSDDGQYARRLDEVLRDLHEMPADPKPALGTNPFLSGVLSPASLPATVSPPAIEHQASQQLVRRRPSDIQAAITHSFKVAGTEGVVIVGLFEDGTPSEITIIMSKGGGSIGGLLASCASLASLLLQYGVPIEALVSELSEMRFEPSGMTENRDIPFAKSIVDYIGRWLGMEFIPGYREANSPQASTARDPASLEFH